MSAEYDDDGDDDETLVESLRAQITILQEAEAARKRNERARLERIRSAIREALILCE